MSEMVAAIRAVNLGAAGNTFAGRIPLPLRRRFADEARDSLPAMASSGAGLPDLDEVDAARSCNAYGCIRISRGMDRRSATGVARRCGRMSRLGLPGRKT